MAKMRQLDPDAWITDYCYGVALAWNRQRQQACSVLAALAARAPESVQPGLATFMRLCLLGQRDEALRAASSDWVSFVREDEFASWTVAACYASIDAKEEALTWLEHTTLTRQFINYPFFYEIDPMLQGLRGDERFERLMESVRKEWERSDP